MNEASLAIVFLRKSGRDECASVEDIVSGEDGGVVAILLIKKFNERKSLFLLPRFPSAAGDRANGGGRFHLLKESFCLMVKEIGHWNADTFGG